MNTTSVEAVKTEVAKNPALYIVMFLLLGGQTGDLFSSSNLAAEVREMREEFGTRITVEERSTVEFEEDIEYLEDEIDDLWDEIEQIRFRIEQLKQETP